HIRIKIVFPVEFRKSRYLGTKCQSCADHMFYGHAIWHRQRTGKGKAHRAHVGIRFAAKYVRTTAKHFAYRLQFHVALYADYGFVLKPNGGELAAGHAIRSQSANAFLKSLAIRVRAVCART